MPTILVLSMQKELCQDETEGHLLQGWQSLKTQRTGIDLGDREDTAFSATSSTSSATSSARVTGLDLLCAAAALVQDQTADQL
ncbi:hypothetical protein MRX96_028509 [Rhipicephalus microplus]